MLDAHRALWSRFSRNFWKVHQLIALWQEAWAPRIRCWEETSKTLKTLAQGADLLLSGVIGEEAAANVAESYGIPFATLHTFPMRPSGQLVPFLPTALARSAAAASEWFGWPMTKKLEDTQRVALGLPKAKRPPSRRIPMSGALEIQAYDSVCFPGLQSEWAQWRSQRPFVGALTVAQPTPSDGEIQAWVNDGTPPIFFGFGSTPVKSPSETLAMISDACTQLGERALVCAAETDFGDIARFTNLKVVSAANYAAVFPACRAVVHHGGGGTTAAGLRAGVPTLILSTWFDQALWGKQVERLKVGKTRRFASVSLETLVADLRDILDADYVARARDIAAHMTSAGESVAVAADHLESVVQAAHTSTPSDSYD
ncbi:glycosyl transferase [Mycobacterium sp. 852002-51961_SCH5331710]|nr:glycosyl transferase [Mycobacterium sp. 852002-51961_SCH5331710]